MSSRTQFRVTRVSPVSAEVGLFVEDYDNCHYDHDDYDVYDDDEADHLCRSV